MAGEIPSDSYEIRHSNRSVSSHTGNHREVIPDAILSFSNNGNEQVHVKTKRDTKKPKKAYQLGPRRGNVRQIGPESVMTSQPQRTFNINGRRLTFTSNTPSSVYSDTTDNYIGDSRQVGRGDCYFMAEINAIRNTKDGQKILTQNLKKHKDGSYTVTLPGALKIKQRYEAQGLYCEVTGTYHISKAALEQAGASSYYSQGDLEVVAFELAMEAYRAEMYLTNKANNTNTGSGTAEGCINTQEIRESGDVLTGGYTHDAGFILTGQKSNAFYATKNRYQHVKPYKDGQYGYITREEMARRTGADVSMYRAKKGVGISEFSHLTHNEQAINSMLNEYEGKEGQFALTFGVRVAEDGPDGATRAGGGHAITIVKITRNIVYVANPWHPDKIEPIPRREFIKMTTSLVAMPVKSNAQAHTNGIVNQNLLNHLNHLIKK